MTKNGCVGIVDCGEETHHGFFLVHLKITVYACNDKVKGCQYLVGIIKSAIVQDVALNAFEDFEGLDLPIQFIDVSVLLFYSFRREAVGIECALRVIRDYKKFITSFNQFVCHFFNGVNAVAPVAVAVNNRANIARLNDGLHIILPGLCKDSIIFS